MNIIDSLADNFSGKADFLCVYIAEAHPTDEWHMEKCIDFTQPKTQAERKTIFERFLKEIQPKQETVMDLISNEIMTVYEAWPERLYIIVNGVIKYRGGTGPFFYVPEEVKAWLDENL